MGFLNSIWLWGPLAAAAVSVPIVIHLFNRFQRRKVQWGAMELLKRSIVVRAKQVRIEDLIVLILRCLALLLLALALARPSLQGGVGKWLGGQQRVASIIAIDGSFSMTHGQFTSRFDGAIDQTRQILSTLSSTDQASLMILGDQPHNVLRNVGYDAAQFRQALDEQAVPRPERLNLEAALDAIDEQLAEMTAPVKECYLITDTQAGDFNQLSDKARRTLESIESKATLFILRAPTPDERNAAVTDLRFVSGTLRPGGSARFAAEIANFSRQPEHDLVATFMVDGQAVDRRRLDEMDPLSRRNVTFVTRFTDPGQRRISVELTPDALTLDNRRYLTANVPESVRVLAVDGHRASVGGRGEAFYLLNALRLKARGANEPLQIARIDAIDLPGEPLSDYNVIALANVPELTGEQADRLKAFVRGGGSLIVFLGDQVDPTAYNRALHDGNDPLLPGELMGVVEQPENAEQVGWAMTATDADHPLARVWRMVPEQLADVARVRALYEIKPDEDAQVILNISQSNLPLMLDKRLGRGSVLLVSTSADRLWTNLPIHPVYPMLLHQAVTELAETRSMAGPYTVGRAMVLPIPGDTTSQNVTILRPDDTEQIVRVTSDPALGQVASVDALIPGIHRLVADSGNGLDANAPAQLFAVNVPADESNVQVADATALEQQLGPVGARLLDGEVSIAEAVRTSRVGRELWRILLVAALLVIIAQAVLARWFAKRMDKGEVDVRERHRQVSLAAARGAA